MMNKFCRFTAALVFIWVLNSCSNEGVASDASDNNDSNSPIVAVIFSDLTSSVDSNSIKKVAKDAYDIILALPYNSVLYVYPIDSTPFVKPILTFEYPKTPRKNSEKFENKRKVKQAASIAANKILQLHREKYSSKMARKKPVSCILRTLETADRLFSGFRARGNSRQKYERYELIYLSDMLEECATSPVGPLFFSKKGYRLTKNNLNSYKPDFDLSYANVSIIVSTDGYAEESKFISSGVLQKAWENIFLKVGFNKEKIRTFNFLPSMPPRLRNFEG